MEPTGCGSTRISSGLGHLRPVLTEDVSVEPNGSHHPPARFSSRSPRIGGGPPSAREVWARDGPPPALPIRSAGPRRPGVIGLPPRRVAGVDRRYEIPTRDRSYRDRRGTSGRCHGAPQPGWFGSTFRPECAPELRPGSVGRPGSAGGELGLQCLHVPARSA